MKGCLTTYTTNSPVLNLCHYCFMKLSKLRKLPTPPHTHTLIHSLVSKWLHLEKRMGSKAPTSRYLAYLVSGKFSYIGEH